MTTHLFGIKNCDTVKKARQWLNDNNIAYTFIDFRETPITRSQLQTWQQHIPMDMLINKRSTSWKGLSPEQKKKIEEGDIIEIVLAQPTLIKRPLLETQNQYFVGFSDKNYRNIFKL